MKIELLAGTYADILEHGITRKYSLALNEAPKTLTEFKLSKNVTPQHKKTYISKTRPSSDSEAATMYKLKENLRICEKRTGPSSWSVQLVRPAGLSSWSVQLVRSAGLSSWSVQLVCPAGPSSWSY